MKNKKVTFKALRSDLKATDRQIGGKHYQLPISPLKFISYTFIIEFQRVKTEI